MFNTLQISNNNFKTIFRQQQNGVNLIKTRLSHQINVISY
jgi:hypothetical protein